MAVYVDDLRMCLRNRNWPYKQSCHLVADTIEELYLFGVLMNLKPEWFQNKPELPHYDLTKGMRRKAVKLGAIEIGGGAIVELMNKNRQLLAKKQNRPKCAGQ